MNFGWALSPIPGRFFATIDDHVFLDGAPIGTVSYNHYRADIATLFSGLANSSGPVGFKVIDTTALADGLHTIAWSVSDNNRGAAGIGSRYFTVQNGSSSLTSTTAGSLSDHRPSPRRRRREIQNRVRSVGTAARR